MITISNLSKSFKNHTIFRDLSLKLPSKGLVLIKGENGSGKTTLLNILSGNDLNYEGDVYFDDIKISTLSNREIQNFKLHNISYIAQKTIY